MLRPELIVSPIHLVSALVFATGLMPGAAAAKDATTAALATQARGKAFVTQHCSKCHATGLTGASKNPKAPPLRTLASRYPLENLEEAFAEGIVVHHGSNAMPAFQLQPQSISDMIEYMKSISKK